MTMLLVYVYTYYTMILSLFHSVLFLLIKKFAVEQ